ncbi:hypothetical protein E2C01_017448 [Portunus trituberculatus]|uniref:Uncharacterized protein n=1 Tax=Portunus trituberculatus TaxID=210409 RepID=A0A5B7DTG8_PORTR|nr:hypothetical protein [Portunus trituberculatus]
MQVITCTSAPPPPPFTVPTTTPGRHPPHRTLDLRGHEGNAPLDTPQHLVVLKPVPIAVPSSRTTACRHLDHPPPPRRMRYGGATFLPSSSTPESVFLYLARERTLPFRPPRITCPTTRHTTRTLPPSHLPRLHGNC